jgi:hypothetical protein
MRYAKMPEIRIKTNIIFELDTAKVIVGIKTNESNVITKVTIPLLGIYPRLLSILVDPEVKKLLPLTFVVWRGELGERPSCSQVDTAKTKQRVPM